MNPLIKVMNLVALLIAPLMVKYKTLTPSLWLLVIGGLLITSGAVWFSKRGSHG